MFSIRQMIGVSLSIVLALHLFTAIMGHFGLEKAKNDLVLFEDANHDTINVLEINRAVTELQKSVADYIFSGHRAAADRVRDLLETVESGIDTAIDGSQSEDTREHLERMRQRIRSYGSSFRKAEIDRAARVRLVNEEMMPIRDRIIERLDSIATADGPHAGTAANIQREFLLGETSALRYLDTPRRAAVDTAVAHFDAVLSLCERPLHGGFCKETQALIADYERAFLNTVTATRGYLHLVNVVLAGDAAQLLSQSQSISNASILARDDLARDMTHAAKQFQIVNDVVAILTVLTGILTASLMTRAVLTPILRLAETFRRLARDDADAVVMFTNRDDEIGILAKSAEVFKAKNADTETLLEESQKLASDLAQRNDEMTQFIYTASHDLRSPLVTVNGFVGILRAQIAAQDTLEAHDTTARIERAVQRMAATLDGLLALSSVSEGAHEPELVSLNALCNGVASDLQSSLEMNEAELRIADDLPDLHTNAAHARHVIQNFIENAVKHGKPREGRHIIELDAKAERDRVVLSVTDRGQGIRQEHASKIFDMFQRLHPADTEGTGIGLAIVRKIAATTGGKVWFESEPDERTTFFFAFPTHRAALRNAA